MSERFSWILPERLAVGSCPHSDFAVARLSRCGVTAVLCLTERHEHRVPDGLPQRFLWERIAIPDGATGGIPSQAQFQQATDTLDRWQRKGHTIYVHCLAGVGRSPAVCAAYLARHYNMEADEALRWVRDCHAWADPDAHQQRAVASLSSPSQATGTPAE